MPSFRQVLDAVADAWRDRRDDVARQAAQLVGAVQHSARAAAVDASRSPTSCSSGAARGLRSQFDAATAAWGGAPKFPNASALEFLLRRGDDEALAIVMTTLDGMAAGGMYDLLGGGFHRYSVDDRWLVPHFEKMLYDNALLGPVYLHGWLVTGNERYRDIAGRRSNTCSASWPAGAAASPRRRTPTRTASRGSRSRGPRRRACPAELLRAVRARTIDAARRARPRAARKLFEQRERRPKPLRDDKAIASWNGLALAALAEAGRRLEEPEWIAAASRLGEFLLGPLSDDEGRLLRSYRAGRTSGTGYLDDYGNVAHGLLELHVATGELRWLEEANRLARLAVELFADEEHGGFFLSPSHGERLVARTKELDDHPCRPATRCSPTCCCGSPGSTATTSSRGERSRCSDSSGPRSSGRRPPSARRSVRSSSTLAAA